MADRATILASIALAAAFLSGVIVGATSAGPFYWGKARADLERSCLQGVDPIGCLIVTAER